MTEFDSQAMETERDAAVSVLSEHYSLGTLSKESFDDRLAAVFAADKATELRSAMDGLTGHPTAPGPPVRTPGSGHHRQSLAKTTDRHRSRRRRREAASRQRLRGTRGDRREQRRRTYRRAGHHGVRGKQVAVLLLLLWLCWQVEGREAKCLAALVMIAVVTAAGARHRHHSGYRHYDRAG
ncbi:DUF1707 SHOCT-like domain-containing protein [Streptomyces cucumeris]|uniref:DUF1707 SHOCT-like domain-containing protein n=1 Tax=Streptomyces cucumeris TaxID=2962890 RepID=UPI003D74D13B